MAGNTQGLPPSAAVVAAGVDHVRLLYAYLDAGEPDGYASLLHEDIHIRGVGGRAVRGREEAIRMLHAHSKGAHEVRTVMSEDGTVTVTGRYTDAAGTVEFADVFTLSEFGLIHSQRRTRA